MILRGRVYDLTCAEGIIACENAQITGLVTFLQEGDTMEITSLDSLRQGYGIGTELLRRAVAHARARCLRQVQLITTNDNLPALGFYQKRGFDMARLYRNALEVSRRLKPGIPLIGEHGIPLRHEIELVYPLTD